MQKIMFNDRYGLTQAVIEGRKTMTRRVVKINSNSSVSVRIFAGYIQIVNDEGRTCDERKLPYRVGEVVAVAQRYADIPDLAEQARDPFSETYFEEEDIGAEPGWCNKMFVKADLMPHRIRITGVRCERLQDISDEDCLKEGINASNSHEIGYGIPWVYEFAGSKMVYYTPREAFAALIDKVFGRGTWGLNPWVVVYEFNL